MSDKPVMQDGVVFLPLAKLVREALKPMSVMGSSVGGLSRVIIFSDLSRCRERRLGVLGF